MNLLEKVRDMFSGLGEWIVRYSNHRASNREARIDTRESNRRETLRVRANIRQTKLDVKAERKRKKAVLSNERIALRQQFWTRIIREFSEFRERLCAVRAERYERKKAASAAATEIKQAARAQRYEREKEASAEAVVRKQHARANKWREFGRAWSRFFAAIATAFRRLVRAVKRTLRSNPSLFRKLSAKVASFFGWVVLVIWTILMSIAIATKSPNLGWFVFFGGPFVFFTIRYFVRKPRPLFPQLGMAVFGLALLFWALFSILG